MGVVVATSIFFVILSAKVWENSIISQILCVKFNIDICQKMLNYCHEIVIN